jgi:hypothetical protein
MAYLNGLFDRVLERVVSGRTKVQELRAAAVELDAQCFCHHRHRPGVIARSALALTVK